MVKRRKKGITKKGTGKGFNERPQEARKIGASTIYAIIWMVLAQKIAGSFEAYLCKMFRDLSFELHNGSFWLLCPSCSLSR